MDHADNKGARAKMITALYEANDNQEDNTRCYRVATSHQLAQAEEILECLEKHV